MLRDLPPDTVVDERYQIVNRIGSGGMADVYCAQDLQLGRKVALKLLHRRFAEDQEFVERFRREASSAAGLQHANVVGVYDRGEWDGTYYIAMEYLEGSSLKQMVQAHAPMDPAPAIELTLQILRAARFAHQRGIIHRDLKPHNVIVDTEGRAKVTDFGIARAGASDMTETGSIMGTAQYLSPEQAQGRAVSAASDLYSIGIILFELLTGRLPFEGDSAVAIAMKQVTEAPVPPSVYAPGVPPELDALVLRALEKDPEHRYTSADEFIAALEAVRAGGGAPGQSTAVFGAVTPGPPTDQTAVADGAFVYPEDPYDPDPERGGRRRWPVVLAVLLLLIGAGLAYALTRPEKVIVPQAVGTQVSAGATILKNAGFKVEVQRVTDPAKKDRVLRQDPQAGDKVDKGSTVTLQVSDGPGQALIPVVQDFLRKQAEKRLRDAGFRVQARSEASDTIAKGHATRTSPSEGQEIEKDSLVTLFISSGAAQVTVPDVTGQTQSAAEAEISGRGLKVEVSEEDSDTKEPGTVLRQTPGGGAKVDKDSTVRIVVARQPKDVSVPDVIGQDQGSASATLSGAGLTVVARKVPVDTQAQDGVVVNQSPASGAKIKRGGRVVISVGTFNPNLGGETPPTTTTPPGTP